MSTTCYVLLPPFAFGPDFDAPSYGSFMDGSDLTKPVLVALVKSGRFTDVTIDVEMELPWSMLRNMVESEEAFGGCATYVGSHVALVYNAPDGSRVWTYGLCIDHDAEAVLVLRPMDKSPLRVSISSQSICVVNLLNMCFQWAANKAISMVRLHDLLAEHDQITTDWDGIPLTKKRSTSLQSSFLNAGPLSVWPNEESRVPCYNPTNGRTVWQPMSHVLDYMFYVLGGRNPPRGLKLLENLFQTLPAVADTTMAQLEPATPLPTRTKPRSKKSVSKNKLVDLDTSLPGSWEDSQALSEDDDGDILERVARSKIIIPLTKPTVNVPDNGEIGVEKSGFQLANEKKSLDAIVDAIGGSSSKSFKPTSTQQLVHNNIATGKCASGVVFESPQQWAEDLQCLTDLGVLFYPGLCKAAFSFEFGRSVQIQELMYGDWISIAEKSEGVDMADFSSKAKKPKVPMLQSISELVQCVSNLSGLAEAIYRAPICAALQRLRAFLLTQQPKWSSMGMEGVIQLTRWVNNRLFALRVALGQQSPDGLLTVVSSFSPHGSEFVDCLDIVRNRRITALESRGSNGGSGNTFGAKGDEGFQNPHKRKRDKDKRALFGALIREVPKQDGKAICFPNLSEKGCSHGEAACVAKGRLHFTPTLTPAAKAAFLKAVGPLRADIA